MNKNTKVWTLGKRSTHITQTHTPYTSHEYSQAFGLVGFHPYSGTLKFKWTENDVCVCVCVGLHSLIQRTKKKSQQKIIIYEVYFQASKFMLRKILMH